jgi:hypothetical protein
MPEAATTLSAGRFGHALVAELFAAGLGVVFAAGEAELVPPGDVVITSTTATTAMSRTVAAEIHHRRFFVGAA